MKSITLYEATTMLKDHIELWADNRFWVTAEIKSLSRNTNGHAYLELIQKAGDSDNTIAEARATIWRNAATGIFSKFLFATDRHLGAGMKVMLLASFAYSQKYGISLNITDIDPTYTVGDMQQRRLQIIKRLTEKGLIGKNRQLPYPVPVKRIAIISSENAAGYTDFMKTLFSNPYGFTYYTHLFPAVMQGERTEQSILDALSLIAGEAFDITVIIRGGGASTDLLAFDSEAIATACACSRIPVITGIGHQRDTSILDMVAYHNAITPTATAEYIIAQSAAIAERLSQLTVALGRASSLFIERNKSALSRLTVQTESVRQLFLQKNRNRLDTLRQNLSATASHYIELQRHLLTGNIERLELLHPDNILRRGYTITTCGGKTVTSAAEIAPGEILETLTANGTIKSTTL